MTFEIIADQRILRLDGAEVPLGARAFDVLVHLHDNADRVVSKAELLDAVWSGIMVEEGNLSVQIAALRKVIGKEAIKTVPGIGYRLTLGPTPAAAQPVLGPEVPSIPSLAVLPFANLTGSGDRDYLVDGIVNEIISALSRVSGIFVISSTSSFTYKGRAIDLSEVGTELGVRYVMEGSIQQAGDRLRIFTSLVEAETAHTIWQERFDGRIDEIFELQDEVAASVAGALEPKMIWNEAARTRLKPTDSLTAYDLCLRAAPLVHRQDSLANLEEGLALLRQALERDPNYTHAKALVCLAHTGSVAARWWTFEQAGVVKDLAKQVLNEAQDDPLALAYAGHYLAYVHNMMPEGLTALLRAEKLNPNSAMVAMLLGWVHNYRNENEDAIRCLRRAMRLSPLHPQIGVMTAGIGNALMQMGRFEEAALSFEQSLSEYPEFATSMMGLMAAYWRLGRSDDCARIAELYREKAPDFSVSYFLKHRPQDAKEYTDAVIGALRATGFPE
ncbi:winged helix-turn-helix domain-containing protein [Roseibacterium sp. SDUM158016]|uniref:winged helix-turn-helix domain-containing protein n=1 Tax=Roseicyclus sediminis TaxID=2980997 RepID=UPI0021D1507E|nr:winged helix-turn-helix domain-containing protein [Roseibacterium sp. SDUM158016]MCU4651314.1 winged helix-turn-helix domain-containing protein [Roseibacterium sp. SDUM158016]